MINRLILAALGIAALGLPIVSHAQGIPEGAKRGAEEGNDAAGPIGGAIGGAVGGAVGGVTGGIKGVLGIEQRPRFKEYVVQEKRPSYRVSRDVVVGAELPAQGIEYYEVPAEYGVKSYRYTVVNDRAVLVDLRTRRIVEVID